MRKSYALAAILACVAIGVLLLQHSFAQSGAPAKAQPTSVAVCDVQKLFGGYTRATDLLAKLNEKRQGLAAEYDQRGKAIEALQQEMEALKPDSAEYRTRAAEIERLKVDRNVSRQVGEAEVLREHRRLTMEMYNEILTAITAVAKERDHQIVLYRDHSLVDTEENLELLAQIGARKLLYCDDGLDITDAVLAKLNDGYTARKP